MTNSFVFFVKENGYLMDKHLDIGKKLLKTLLDKKGHLVVIKFPQKSITKKPTGVRIGKGKGPVVSWVCPVYAGNPIFAVRNVKEITALKLFNAVKKKIPLAMSIYIRRIPLSR